MASETFKLKIQGADEDLPRMILAFGRGCGGEVALVVRPRDNAALLLLQMKGQATAKLWRTKSGQAPSEPRVELDSVAAVEELKSFKANPPAAGPATLRGAWSGVLECGAAPVVKLERKIVSYGVLRITSRPAGGWTATFDRAARWFGQAQSQSVERASLADAVTAGMGLVIGLVSEACSFRDTRKRGAVDPVHAAQHPPKPRAEPKDPTERVKPAGQAKPPREKKAATEAKPPREKKAATEAKPPRQRRDAAAPAAKQSEAPMPPSCPTSVARIASATTKDADALAELSQSVWGATETPQMLARAERLIQHAKALASSPLCTGAEQKRAFEDIDRASEAYEKAKSAVANSEQKALARSLRQVAERVSLSAARVAKACAGQAKPVTPKPTAAKPVPVKSPDAPARAPRAKAEPEIDPAKDALLMDAFRSAISSALAAA